MEGRGEGIISFESEKGVLLFMGNIKIRKSGKKKRRGGSLPQTEGGKKWFLNP